MTIGAYARRGQATISEDQWRTDEAWQEWRERDRLFKLSPGYARYHQRITDLINAHRDIQIETAIRGSSPGVLEQFTTLSIKESADAKARYYSKRVCELGGASYELSMAIASRQDEAGLTIENLEPFFHQGVRLDECHEVPKGISATIDNLNALGQKMIGWAHSHGTLFSCFPSPTDRFRIKKDLGWLGKRFYVNQHEGNPQGDIVYATPALIYNANLRENEAPYAAIAVGYWSRYNPRKFRIFLNRVKLRVIKDDAQLDFPSLDQILLERVWCIPPEAPRELGEVYDFFGNEQFRFGESLREKVRRRGS
ncbi:hypothetical protein J4419_00370 [Candidatus Woesearchaeota archaeon]|nr:hypothetical protein [Candidatus Woesearchaeota archaeon]